MTAALIAWGIVACWILLFFITDAEEIFEVHTSRTAEPAFVLLLLLVALFWPIFIVMILLAAVYNWERLKL